MRAPRARLLGSRKSASGSTARWRCRRHRLGRCHPGGAGHGGRLCLHRLGLSLPRTRARAATPTSRPLWTATSDDIVYSNLFTGVHGNYLALSIRAAGLDPENLPESDLSKMNFGGDAKKAWICGQAHQRRDQHR